MHLKHRDACYLYAHLAIINFNFTLVWRSFIGDGLCISLILLEFHRWSLVGAPSPGVSNTWFAATGYLFTPMFHSVKNIHLRGCRWHHATRACSQKIVQCTVKNKIHSQKKIKLIKYTGLKSHYIVMHSYFIMYKLPYNDEL